MKVKKILSFVVAFVMLLGIVNIPAFASETGVEAATTPEESLVPTSAGYGTIKTYAQGEGDANGTYVHLNIDTAYAEESLVLELYAGNTLLSTTKLDDTQYLKWTGRLTANIEISREADAWETEWFGSNPNAFIVPTAIKVYADGDLAFETTVNVTSEEWAATEGVNTLKGEGTVDNPYLIKAVADLELFRDSVNAGYNYKDKYVKLTNNIDLSSVDNWTPIGDTVYNNNYAPAYPSKAFSGVFDGNSKTIFNLKIEKNTGEGPDGISNTGLFGIIGEGAVIKDLTITNVNINTDGRNVGALAGVAYKATLENITINGNIQIKGGNNVSGVCAMTRYYDMSATNITVSGADGSSITGNNIVGGIFAEIAPDGSTQTFNNLSVENVAIKGDRGVGGIVGLLTNGSVSNVSVKKVDMVGNTSAGSDSMGRIRMGSVAGLLGGTSATVSNIAVENVTAKNLAGEDVVLPVIGANYDASSNATEARIGDKYYATLEKAIDEANGKTVTLVSDITLKKTVTIEKGKNITLDLNGYTIGFDSEVWVYGATNSGTAILTVNFGGELTINDSSDARTGKIDGYDANAKNSPDEYKIYGAVMMTAAGDDSNNGTAKLTVNGGTLIGTFAGIGGNRLRDNTEIVINGGTIKCGISEGYSSVGIDHPQNGKLTVNGGYIEGMDGISLRSGTLLITGGTIVGNAPASAFEDEGYWDNNFGTCTGHALQIVSRANSEATQETPSVSITGGTFKAVETDAVGSYAGYKGATPDTQITGFITGGTFSSDVSAYCADGYKLVENADGTYGVTEGKDIFGGKFAIINMPMVDGYYRCAFVSGIDSLKYKEVGFKFYCDGKEVTSVSTKKVYSSITVTSSDGSKKTTVKASDIDAFRMFYQGVKFDPEKWDNTPIQYQPYAVTLDGETILGKTVTLQDIYTLD